MNNLLHGKTQAGENVNECTSLKNSFIRSVEAGSTATSSSFFSSSSFFFFLDFFSSFAGWSSSSEYAGGGDVGSDEALPGT